MEKPSIITISYAQLNQSSWNVEALNDTKFELKKYTTLEEFVRLHGETILGKTLKERALCKTKFTDKQTFRMWEVKLVDY